MKDLDKLKQLKFIIQKILQELNTNDFDMDIINEDGYYLAVWVKNGDLTK